MPGIYHEFPFDSDGKTGDDCGDAVGVLFDVAGDCEYSRSSCLYKLFLQIKALQFVEGDNSVCVRVNDCSEPLRREWTCQYDEGADLFDDGKLLDPPGKLVHHPSQCGIYL